MSDEAKINPPTFIEKLNAHTAYCNELITWAREILSHRDEDRSALKKADAITKLAEKETQRLAKEHRWEFRALEKWLANRRIAHNRENGTLFHE